MWETFLQIGAPLQGWGVGSSLQAEHKALPAFQMLAAGQEVTSGLRQDFFS